MISSPACLVLVYAGETEGEQIGHRFEVPGSHLIIGRGVDADLQVDLDAVSRRHASLQQDGGRWQVVDLNSTNGTYIGDQLIGEGPHPIQDGDELRVGVALFRFLCGPDLVRRYLQEVRRLGVTDGLTGAANRRQLLSALEREAGRAGRHGRPLSLLRLDVEQFKALCDSHGALTGDYLLREVARRVHAELRPDDLLARSGREQFAVLLPETDGEAAQQLGARIAEAVARTPCQFGEERLPVSLAVGAAARGDGDHDGAALLRSAEEQVVRARVARR